MALSTCHKPFKPLGVPSRRSEVSRGFTATMPTNVKLTIKNYNLKTNCESHTKMRYKRVVHMRNYTCENCWVVDNIKSFNRLRHTMQIPHSKCYSFKFYTLKCSNVIRLDSNPYWISLCFSLRVLGTLSIKHMRFGSYVNGNQIYNACEYSK